MNAGLGLMPFPSLGKINNEDLPDLIRCMELEVDLKLDKAEAGRFWVATLMFLGLKFEKEFIDFLMKGVENMKASTYHKAIFE